MRPHRMLLVQGGGTVVLALLVISLLAMTSTSSAGAEASVERDLGDTGRTASDCDPGATVAGWIIVILGFGCVSATVLGTTVGRKENAWPHWRRLVRGQGELAFLVGLLTVLTVSTVGFGEIMNLGSAVTSADWLDLAHYLGSVLPAMVLGTSVAIVSLLGAGVLRLMERADK